MYRVSTIIYYYGLTALMNATCSNLMPIWRLFVNFQGSFYQILEFGDSCYRAPSAWVILSKLIPQINL